MKATTQRSDVDKAFVYSSSLTLKSVKVGGILPRLFHFNIMRREAKTWGSVKCSARYQEVSTVVISSYERFRVLACGAFSQCNICSIQEDLQSSPASRLMSDAQMFD